VRTGPDGDQRPDHRTPPAAAAGTGGSAPGQPGGRSDAATPLPPSPYLATPPPSAPFAAPVGNPPPAQPALSRPPVPAAENLGRWVPAADDTQVITALPPVPRPAGEDDEDAAGREGAERRDRGRSASGGILRTAGTMAVATLISRITGLIRTMVLAAALGVGLVNDAYNTANTLPNIVYELLLGGVLTSVVVPLLVHAQERDKDGGTAYAQRLATIAVTFLVAVTVVAVLAAPLLTRAYGITGDPDQVRLANWLARLLLIEIVFYGLGAFAQAILNSRGVFGPPAWAPVLNNLVVIATGVLFLAASGPGALEPARISSGQVWLLGIGTTLGIAVQAVVLLPLLGRAGVPVRPRWGMRNTGLREAGGLGLWVLGYVAMTQVGVAVAIRVANAAGREGELGSAAFAYASMLFQMPYGIIGVALLTALVPRMSRAASRHDVEAVVEHLSMGTRLVALGLLPVTAALMVLGPSLATLAFARGNTTAEQAQAIGQALVVGAFGLLPLAVTLLQLRVFYAMKDARTPTLIQIGTVAVRVPLLVLLPAVVEPEHVVAGIMLITSASYLVGWVIGQVALRRRFGNLRSRETMGPVLRVALVSALAGGIGWAVLRVTDDLFGASMAGSLGRVLVGTVVIGATALAGLVVARVPELQGPLASVRARIGRG
jgi:putative peptidoglycan lipid II flippase